MRAAPTSSARIRIVGLAMCLLAGGGFWWQYLCLHNGELFSAKMALVSPLLLAIGLLAAIEAPPLPIRIKELSPLGLALFGLGIGAAVANYIYVLQHTGPPR